MDNGSRPHIPDFDVEGGAPVCMCMRESVYVCVEGALVKRGFSVALSRTKGNGEKQQEGREQRREKCQGPAVTGLWEGVMEWVKE